MMDFLYNALVWVCAIALCVGGIMFPFFMVYYIYQVFFREKWRTFRLRHPY